MISPATRYDHPICRIILHGRAMLLALAAVSLAGPHAHGDDQPNIVLIMADDLGYETLGCYGGESYSTPVLDELARTGMRFNHAYAQPLCTNTRLQLMTGRYNHRNWVAFGILDPRERTFGHYLQRAGYTTCIAGKWQLQSYDPPDYPGSELRRGIGMSPENAGFDEYCLWHAGHTELKGSRYADPRILQNGEFLKSTEGLYGPDVWANYISDFLERHRKGPFFVYYPMALTHGPFTPTPDSVSWGDAERRHASDKRLFGDMVRYMDKTIGRIVSKIDQLGLRERTLILFFSDNGSPLGVTSRLAGRDVAGGKGMTTDAGTRVPLIANWRGVTPAGVVSNDLIDSTDFLPTLLDVAGHSTLPEVKIDGRSFLPQLRGERGDPRSWVFYHFDPRPGWDKDRRKLYRYAQDQKFKLYDDGRLFDLPADALEQNAIAPEEESQPAKRARATLQAVLDAMKQEPNERQDAYRRAIGSAN
jgi:arylsulfatase A-like enzyme